MPEEPDVEGGSHQAEDTSDNAPDVQDEVKSQTIPYDRFKEVNDEKNLLREQNVRMENALRDTMSQLLAKQNEPAPEPDPEPDKTYSALARAKYGQGEEGDEAYEAVRQTVLAELKEQGVLDKVSTFNPDDIVNKVTQLVDQKLNNFTSTFRTSNRISKWQSDGWLTPDDAGKVNARMQQLISENPAWESNMDHLANFTFMELAEAGTIKPFTGKKTPVTPNSPLQPGYNTPPPKATKEDKLAAAKEIASKFPSLAGLSDEVLLQRFGDKMPGGSNQPIVTDPDSGEQIPAEAYAGRFTPGGRE